MIGNIRKFGSLLTPEMRRKAGLMLALIVMMATAETLGVLSIMPFLSVLGRPEVVHENVWLQRAFAGLGFTDTRRFIVALGLASIAVVVTSSAFKTIAHHALNRFVHFLRHSISSRLLSTYLEQPYVFFLEQNSAELLKSVISEADQLLFDLVHPLSQVIAQGAIILAMALLIVCFDPWMAAIVLLCVALLYGVIYVIVRSRLALAGAARLEANRERYQASNEVLGGIKDVKVNNSVSAYLRRFDIASRQFSRHSATAETLSQTPLYLVEAAGYSGLILIALALLMRTNDVAHVLPALGLYGFAAYRMLPAAQIVYRGFAKLRFSAPTLEAIYLDLMLPRLLEAHSLPAIVPRREIRLENVSFAYPSAPDRLVLDGVSLVIPANSSVGIVGRSGAGKSTAMDVILGLLSPTAGTLSVDGKPITPDNVRSWRAAIGYVPQVIYLIDATLVENIAFGVPKRDIDMQAVERAAKAAQIHDFIRALPEGYETVVGERGVRLSGGQRQRIGIARALYRDPPVLLLDEATSALDVETEDAINDAVLSGAGARTIIIISHRESSLRKCNGIYSIETKTFVSLN